MKTIPGTIGRATLIVVAGLLTAVTCPAQKSSSLSEGLVGHWQLSENTKDASTNKLQTKVNGTLSFNGQGPKSLKGKAATFNGVNSWLEVPSSKSTQLGEGDFSLATWVYTDASTDDVLGDLISQYDLKTRKGFHLSLKSNASPTSQSSYRQLTFSIDDAKSGPWVDQGQPGTALMAFALAEYKGELYAGVCQPGTKEAGAVFKYKGTNQWENCGSPDRSNSVTALAVLDGVLYAGTGHYRVSGSSLPNSGNETHGGKVFRYEGPGRWVQVGQLPGVECIGGMAVYNGKLYASSQYAPSGFFRYDGDNKWVNCGNPGKRVVNMGVFNGYLYATSWDHGNVYRYNGSAWEDCGLVGDNTQNYAFNIYEGKLHSATWPSGRVFRFDGMNKWADAGRLGKELEVMAMMTYNGQMLGGTLPLAEVHVYEGDTNWTRMDQLDRTPDVKYRRAWTMAEHDGKVFCSTLPSGKIFSYESGKTVASPESLPAGWQHVSAVKTAGQLRLYINGKLVSERAIPADMKMNLDNSASLKIGFGSNDYLLGRLRDVRLYKRALSAAEISSLSKK